MPVVKTESRICFGITWFDDEAEADKYAQSIAEAGRTYNGGYFDGMPCGRDTSFDFVMADGRKAYAVTD